MTSPWDIAMEERDDLRGMVRTQKQLAEVTHDEIARLRAELEAAREAIRKAWKIDNDPNGDLSRDWFDLPAVRAALEERK